MKKGWDFDLDVEDKLTKKYFNLPDNGTALRDYVVNVLELKLKPDKFAKIASAKIVYTDLRTGLEVSVVPSVFKQKIKPLVEYDPKINFIRLNAKDMGTSSEEIAECAYYSLIKKF